MDGWTYCWGEIMARAHGGLDAWHTRPRCAGQTVTMVVVVLGRGGVVVAVVSLVDGLAGCYDAIKVHTAAD